MEKRLKSPCGGCKSEGRCTYPGCRAYQDYANRFWTRCRRWPERQQKRRPRGFAYDAPYLVARSLDRGPCPECPLREFCGDMECCESYDAWVKARMARIRHRLGK